jgi:hypothetical protein
VRHQRQRRAHLGQQRVERHGLRQRAREPVEDHAFAAVVLLDARAQHRDGQLVGHELARFEIGLDLQAQLRAAPNVVAEQIARRDAREAELRLEPLALGALTGSRRAEQDDGRRHYRMNPS